MLISGIGKKVMEGEERTLPYLKQTVGKIYQAIKETEKPSAMNLV